MQTSYLVREFIIITIDYFHINAVDNPYILRFQMYNYNTF